MAGGFTGVALRDPASGGASPQQRRRTLPAALCGPGVSLLPAAGGAGPRVSDGGGRLSRPPRLTGPSVRRRGGSC